MCAFNPAAKLWKKALKISIKIHAYETRILKKAVKTGILAHSQIEKDIASLIKFISDINVKYNYKNVKFRNKKPSMFFIQISIIPINCCVICILLCSSWLLVDLSSHNFNSGPAHPFFLSVFPLEKKKILPCFFF